MAQPTWTYIRNEFNEMFRHLPASARESAIADLKFIHKRESAREKKSAPTGAQEVPMAGAAAAGTADYKAPQRE